MRRARLEAAAGGAMDLLGQWLLAAKVGVESGSGKPRRGGYGRAARLARRIEGRLDTLVECSRSDKPSSGGASAQAADDGWAAGTALPV